MGRPHVYIPVLPRPFFGADAVWGLTGEDLQPNDRSTLSPLVQFGPASGQIPEVWISPVAVSNVSLVYTNKYKNNSWSAGHTYHSPVLHHVLVQGLEPRAEYAYRVGGLCLRLGSSQLSRTACPIM